MTAITAPLDHHHQGPNIPTDTGLGCQRGRFLDRVLSGLNGHRI